MMVRFSSRSTVLRASAALLLLGAPALRALPDALPHDDGATPCDSAVASSDAGVPLATWRPPDGVTRYAVRAAAQADTSLRTIGSMLVEQRTTHAGHACLIQRVITFDYGSAGSVVDTTVTDATSLHPVLERTHKPGGIVSYDFAGHVVTGFIGSLTAPRPVHDSLPVLAFNSTDADVVVASLALRSGLAATIPLYDPEMGGFRRAHLEVIGRDTVDVMGAPTSAWLIHMRDNELDIMYRVDAATHLVLRKDIVDRAHDRRYELVRLS